MRTLLLMTLCMGLPATSMAEEPAAEKPVAHLARFATGTGPTHADGTYRLLDTAKTERQSNAIAFDRQDEAAHGSATLRCQLRVLEGGDGGALVFLNTRAYGAKGPAPFVPSWVEPNLKQTFAVGLDVHNPPSKEMFTPWGNYQDRPQREVSLHWDGREIVKRVAPKEFRGDFTDVEVALKHVVGGAEATVKIAGALVYDRYFLAHVTPYPMRLAMGAGTRGDATTEFDVKDVAFTQGERVAAPRRPLHVEVFNHVLTNNKKTAYETEVSLPPADWAFGRVILTLDIHDAGKDWDEWDRNGEISIWDGERKLGIVPFITSYRTACHWKVDVTHFRPLLAGKRKMEVRAGTTFYKNRGYMMSVSLDFHHGTPQRVPYRVVPLWVGTARYKSAENHFQDFFEPRTVALDAETVEGKIFTTATGHSQIGEFTPSKRAITFSPQAGAEEADEKRFTNVLWKTDVYLNPNRPQSGTWQYARAGWAPGDVVRPWWIDVPVVPSEGGQKMLFRYESKPYEADDFQGKPTEKQINQASHVVRSYLILYRVGEGMITAPVLLITNVAGKSNAANAGIKKGDYLASYDGMQLSSVNDLRVAIQGAAGGGRERVTVVVFRGTERLELELAVGRMGISLGSR